MHAGEAVARDGAWAYPDSPLEELRDLVRFEWQAVDEWLEEDELVYVHPRSPYSRVDILASSRRVQVDGGRGASWPTPAGRTSCSRPGLPPATTSRCRTCAPSSCASSDRVTQCPYKGTADYWSVQVGDRRYDDFVWMYRSPLAESAKVAGLVCFYNEKVDLIIDGVPQERPNTPFS